MTTHWPDLAKLKTAYVDPGTGLRHVMGLREQAASDFMFGADGDVRYEGLRRLMWFTWPEFVKNIVVAQDKSVLVTTSDRWNPWMARMLKAFTNTEHVEKVGETIFRYVGLTGCGGAGKTHSAGAFAMAWWGVDPTNSIVILTSTTVGMIRHRIWPVVSHYAKNAYDVVSGKHLELGHMVESQMELRASKGDAKHAVFALAVAMGETQKAIHNLKGMHAKRILLIIDEANGTPEAIFETIPNLAKGALDVTVIIIGNPWSRMDPHGRAITPEGGWGTFSEDKLEWRSRSVAEWGLPSGVILRFDGKDSPNVKLKRNAHPYIYTYDNWMQDNKPERLGTLQYWIQCRGAHPPSGIEKTIFNEQLFDRCDADNHFEWLSEKMKLAFLDPSFTSGGDACVLQIAEMGDIRDGKKALQLTEVVDMEIDANAAAHDIDYQIGRRVIEECKRRNIRPECFGLDATGTGRGVGAIMASEWSSAIHYTTWGSSATERSSAQNDGRPGKEVYNNFVCEMWFAAREMMEAGQLKGFGREAKQQFCSRMYDMAGKKFTIEPKSEMKERVRYSPDYADAVVGVVEVARRNGLMISGKIAQVQSSEWKKQVMDLQDEGGLEVDAVCSVAMDGGWGLEDVG